MAGKYPDSAKVVLMCDACNRGQVFQTSVSELHGPELPPDWPTDEKESQNDQSEIDPLELILYQVAQAGWKSQERMLRPAYVLDAEEIWHCPACAHKEWRRLVIKLDSEDPLTGRVPNASTKAESRRIHTAPYAGRGGCRRVRG
jgi:hypothetical protein